MLVRSLYTPRGTRPRRTFCFLDSASVLPVANCNGQLAGAVLSADALSGAGLTDTDTDGVYTTRGQRPRRTFLSDWILQVFGI